MASRSQVGQDLARNWRTLLDRAWRSASVRRLFEAECGLAPLPTTDEGAFRQAISGQAALYQERFLIWATKHFGLVDQAPSAIQNRIAAER